MRPRLSSTVALLALVFFTGPRARAAAPPAGLAPAELDGIWARKGYLDAVRKTRSPLAQAAETVTFSSDGRWKMSWSSFHEASWRTVASISPAAAPGRFTLAMGPWESADVAGAGAISAGLRVTRAKNGRLVSLTFTDELFIENANEPFVRIDEPLPALVNRLVVVGTYRDARGRVYRFTDVGVAETPDGPYTYEVQLDPSESGCDYLKRFDKTRSVGWTPVGFRWRAGRLELLKVVEGADNQAPLACAEPPVAVLTPVKPIP